MTAELPLDELEDFCRRTQIDDDDWRLTLIAKVREQSADLSRLQRLTETRLAAVKLEQERAEAAEARVRELEEGSEELIIFLARILNLLPPNGKHWEQRMHAFEAVGRARALLTKGEAEPTN